MTKYLIGLMLLVSSGYSFANQESVKVNLCSDCSDSKLTTYAKAFPGGTSAVYLSTSTGQVKIIKVTEIVLDSPVTIGSMTFPAGSTLKSTHLVPRGELHKQFEDGLQPYFNLVSKTPVDPDYYFNMRGTFAGTCTSVTKVLTPSSLSTCERELNEYFEQKTQLGWRLERLKAGIDAVITGLGPVSFNMPKLHTVVFADGSRARIKVTVFNVALPDNTHELDMVIEVPNPDSQFHVLQPEVETAQGETADLRRLDDNAGLRIEFSSDNVNQAQMLIDYFRLQGIEVTGPGGNLPQCITVIECPSNNQCTVSAKCF